MYYILLVLRPVLNNIIIQTILNIIVEAINRFLALYKQNHEHHLYKKLRDFKEEIIEKFRKNLFVPI